MDNVEIFLLSFVCICLVLAAAGGIYLFVNRGKDDEDDDELKGIRDSHLRKQEERAFEEDENREKQYQDEWDTGNSGQRHPIAIVREKSPYIALNSAKIRVIVDGIEISEISSGERQVISLPEGNHAVTFSTNRNKESVNFYLGPNGATVTCSLKSKWNGIFVQAKAASIFIDIPQNEHVAQQKTGWHQIPLLIRIVIWLFVIGFLLQFIVGFLWGMSIGLS